MKKLAITLFILLIFFGGIYAVLQGNFGRNFTKNLIISSLEKAGFKTTIGKIEGTIPHSIQLKEVSLQKDHFELKASEISFRIVLWRLLEKELGLNDLIAKEIQIQNMRPLDFSGKLRLTQKSAVLSGQIETLSFSSRLDIPRKVVRFIARHPLVSVKGMINLTDQFEFISSNFQINSAAAPLPGRLFANGMITKANDQFNLRGSWRLPKLKGAFEGSLAQTNLKGFVTADSTTRLDVDLEMRELPILTGTLNFSSENLQSLGLIYGKVDAKATLSRSGNVQELQLDVGGQEIYYGSLFAKELSFYSNFQDPFHNWRGGVDLELQKGTFGDLTFETLSFEAAKGDEQPFKLFIEGKYKRPLELKLAGSWEDSLKVHVDTLNGRFDEHPLTLNSPFNVSIAPNQLTLSNVNVTIEEGTLELFLDHQKETTTAALQLKEFPLDLFEASMKGALNLDLHLKEGKKGLKGEFSATIENGEFAGKSGGSGNLMGEFNKDSLLLKGHIAVNEEPTFDLDVSLPIHLSLWPFEAQILYHKEAKGHIAIASRIENLIDFLNLSPHRLEGYCSCKIDFTNTLYRPLIEGYLFFEDGFYQNYYTGTELTDIQAEFFAEKNIIYLRSLKAKDRPETGNLSATGNIRLLQSDLYPFELDVSFDNLQFAEIDLVQASTTGAIHIEGNLNSALAKGDLEIVQAQLNIPDHIPTPLPDLQVVYINQIKPIEPPKNHSYTPYPLFLDLNIHAPDNISIAGRGLNSQWGGDFHLTGSLTSPAAVGSLNLSEGSFSFSSRDFRLTEGSLTLTGKEHEMPLLNLAGTTETGGITITARLIGPLNNPQLKLQSTPPLPLSSLMSHLLFGQDISEISGFQALELASSLASLAGTGPDIMESTRRSLGVDRLRVITDPTEEGGETVALQVGKYVSKGVLVTFTQGASESAPNISVEVEIKGNIVLQIQSDQAQEQGIFTIKWNLNY